MDLFDLGSENKDKEYPGNIWGWKFSFISLGIIVVLLCIAIYRYSLLDQPSPIFEEQPILESDSVNLFLPENH